MNLKTLIIITLCLMFITLSCSKEEENLEVKMIGTWIFTARSVNNEAQTLSDCEKQHKIQLKESNLCVVFDGCTGISTNTGWNYKNEMLNIALYLPAAFKIDHLDQNTMVLIRQDISDEGTLQLTTLSYQKEN